MPTAYCNKHIDERDTVWEFTEGGTVVTKSCPAGYTGTFKVFRIVYILKNVPVEWF